ncbi:MAG: ABC transporter permease [Clostridia bacterium]|nr:ABC transporter permease [Clostridia bacterium]
MNMITKVALSNDKKNKTRSILVMFTIFLTTALLTIICIYANAMIRMNVENAALNYGSYYGVFANLSEGQLKEADRRGEIANIGIMSMAGLIESEDNVSFVAADKTVRHYMNLDSHLLEGDFPRAENEIAAQTAFLESMGYPDAKIGDHVVLSYRRDKEHTYEETEFVISGLMSGVESTSARKSFIVCCSENFYQSRFENEERSYNVYFELNEAVPVNMENVEDTIIGIAAKCGIDERQVNVNRGYLIWRLDPGIEMITACVIIALCVIIFSSVVIYNIFQVGIVQKVQEYGKIRALGATKKQMRKLIFREGMLLTIFSIPTGLIAGYLIAWGSFRWLVEEGQKVTLDYENKMVSVFSAPMILLTAFLALVTVVAALRKPMKIVGKISPVEAIRYQENSKKKKTGLRKGKKNVTVYSMAMANITGRKKRTITTVLTMGLSCVLFVVLANSVGNMDSEYEARNDIAHGQFQIRLVYDLNDEAYPENNLGSVLKNNPLNEQLIEKVNQIPGVTRSWTREILEAEINGKIESVAVMNQEDFEHMRSDTTIGDMDYGRAVENGDIFYGWSYFIEENGYFIGKDITLNLNNGTEKYEYNGMITGAFGDAQQEFVLPEETYKKVNPSGNSYGYLWVDCKESDVTRVQQELESLINGMAHVELQTYHDALTTAETSVRMMKLACYLFMAIIGLISFMNLANTMIMNIITKKQEYGILQAVGMTGKQLNTSLQLQGLVFTVGTVLVALGIGLPAGYGLFRYAKSSGLYGMNIYHIPVTEILVMIILIAALQLILSFVLSKNIKKETLVERIRYQG